MYHIAGKFLSYKTFGKGKKLVNKVWHYDLLKFASTIWQNIQGEVFTIFYSTVNVLH